MAEEGNGRITDAILGERLTQMSLQLASMNGKMDLVVGAVQENAKDIVRHDERLKAQERLVEAQERLLESMSRRSNLLDAVVSLGTAFGIFLGLNRP
jgi:hypothetical protein